jgi:hypothetical protein
MRVREAKDFLVHQTAEQAALEGLPLSDLERRMMYFTEGKGALEDPTTLNDEFEAQYDSAKFERKISRLMRHAHKRLKKEGPEKAQRWDKAIRTLRRGDHYILVMWGHPLSHSSPRDWATYVVLTLPAAIVWFIGFFLGPRRNGHSPYSSYFPPPNLFAVRIMQILFLAVLVLAIFFPNVIFKPVEEYLDRLLDWIEGPKQEEDSAE